MQAPLQNVQSELFDIPIKEILSNTSTLANYPEKSNSLYKVEPSSDICPKEQTNPETNGFRYLNEVKNYYKNVIKFKEASSLIDLETVSCHKSSFIVNGIPNNSVFLRGVNVGGNCKIPYSTESCGGYEKLCFKNHKNVSFVNKPFPLSEANEHFQRLKSWGLTFIRLLVPWEALEHAGPGIYDYEYIEYLKRLLEIMEANGLKCMIDPHQDMWSRFSGGSGAPGWTLEAVGFDLANFTETGAAYIHDEKYAPNQKAPKMRWITNSTKLVTSTMFTVFFGGRVFAPNMKVDNKNIQDYLQDHYINCYKNLAIELKDSKAVLGFESMNEPEAGYIGMSNLKKYKGKHHMFLGEAPSPVQQYALGSGQKIKVSNYKEFGIIPSIKFGRKLVNKKKKSVWRSGYDCIWKQHGVWKLNGKTPKLLQHDYFCKNIDNKPTSPHNRVTYFNQNFYKQFLQKYTESIKQINTKWLLFIEPMPNTEPPKLSPQEKDNFGNLVYSPHWYDLYTLFTKKFDGLYSFNVLGLQKSVRLKHFYFGLNGLVKNYADQLKLIRDRGIQNIGETPLIIGECGIPMDLNNKTAFKSGDYKYQSRMMNAVMSAFERSLCLNFTLWTYNPYNEYQIGDFWNGEDFSIITKNKSLNHTKKIASETSLSTTTIESDHQTPVNICTNTNFEVLSDDMISPASNTFTEFSDRTTFEQYNFGRFSSDTASTETNSTKVDIGDKIILAHDQVNKPGRVLDAIIRPYVARVNGTLVSTSFDIKTTTFKVSFIPKTNEIIEIEKEKSDDNDIIPFGEWVDKETGEQNSGVGLIAYVPIFHYKLNELDSRKSP
ncbi:hypothetical protein BB558_002038 [Smittium angustum]|uniref:Glycoside hydrolase family 5 domain-containing protein n=1 Tax=Smittium angustum TaxID=133377 RepID=A0A2U1J9Z7_SMIAN|nr:hypothetical protein BB558_002038 [Smittium angustum]